MTEDSVVIVGGPASGKTNYIARLWLSFKSKKGMLRAQKLPSNIEYVNDAVQHLLARRFAPRTERNVEVGGRRDLIVTVRADNGEGPERMLTVPDITGELWQRAIATYEIPHEWLERLKRSSAAIMFIRAHSRFNLQPMDWVTARDLMGGAHEDNEDEDEGADEDYGCDEDEDGSPIPGSRDDQVTGGRGDGFREGLAENGVEILNEGERVDEPVEENEANSSTIGLPAQVGFCELFRYMETTLANKESGARPRLAVVITAWDMLDAEAKAAGPMQYLEDQFPIFAGRLQSRSRLEVEVFGMSIVGGNLRGPANKDFRDSLKTVDLSEVGYAVLGSPSGVQEYPDVTIPLAWALEG